MCVYVCLHTRNNYLGHIYVCVLPIVRLGKLNIL